MKGRGPDPEGGKSGRGPRLRGRRSPSRSLLPLLGTIGEAYKRGPGGGSQVGAGGRRQRRGVGLEGFRDSWDLLAGKIAVQEASRNRLNFVAISTSFLERLGTVFGGQDGSKIHQNPSKIDAKMHSYLGIVFSSIFDRFLLPSSTSRPLKFIVFPKEK